MKRGRPSKQIPFEAVLNFVKQGLTTKDAILKAGSKDRTWFYSHLTKEQRLELRLYRVSKRKQGVYLDADNYLKHQFDE